MNNNSFENEIWKPILGYEGLYEVSDMGRVRSLERKVSSGRGWLRTICNKILKQRMNTDNYPCVVLWKSGNGKNYAVHSLVAQTFLDYKLDKTYMLVCDHIDNNRLNNKLSNLQIITFRENLSKEKRGKSKYTGVYWDSRTKKWYSTIVINDKRPYIGCFDSEIDAHNEYQRALKEFKTTGKITRPMVKCLVRKGKNDKSN